MARLWSSGFELNSTTSGVEASVFSAITVSTTLARSGNYGIEQASDNATHFVDYQFSSATAKGPFYGRAYYHFIANGSGTTQIMTFDNSATPTTDVVSIEINSNGTLQLRDEDGAIGSPSAAISTGTWFYLELMIDTTAAAGSHVVTARLNGATFATSSTRNLSVDVNHFYVGSDIDSNTIATSGGYYIDDVAINDATGSFQNSWPGEGEIIHLLPDGAGDAANWTGAFTDVDEVTPDDATTVIESTTLDQVEEVTLAATPAALASDDTINCVQVGVRFRADGAAEPSFVLRIKAASAGTVEESANITPTTTTWSTNAIAVPINYALTLYDLPGASTTAWAKADLDTAQIGVRISADATDNIEVSTLWLLVDHKPAAAVPGNVTRGNLLLLGVG